jgi:hypothetical protein
VVAAVGANNVDVLFIDRDQVVANLYHPVCRLVEGRRNIQCLSRNLQCSRSDTASQYPSRCAAPYDISGSIWHLTNQLTNQQGKHTTPIKYVFATKIYPSEPYTIEIVKNFLIGSTLHSLMELTKIFGLAPQVYTP